MTVYINMSEMSQQEVNNALGAIRIGELPLAIAHLRCAIELDLASATYEPVQLDPAAGSHAPRTCGTCGLPMRWYEHVDDITIEPALAPFLTTGPSKWGHVEPSLDAEHEVSVAPEGPR